MKNQFKISQVERRTPKTIRPRRKVELKSSIKAVILWCPYHTRFLSLKSITVKPSIVKQKDESAYCVLTHRGRCPRCTCQWCWNSQKRFREHRNWWIQVWVSLQHLSCSHVQLDYNLEFLSSSSHSYEQSDGQKRDEEAVVNNLGSDKESIAIRGSFSFLGDDGQTYTVTYVADENGFQPSAAHIPSA